LCDVSESADAASSFDVLDVAAAANNFVVSGAAYAAPSFATQECVAWGRTLAASPRVSDGASLHDFYGEAVPSSSFAALVDGANRYCEVAGDNARDVSRSAIMVKFESLGWLFGENAKFGFPNTKGLLNLNTLFFTTVPWNIQRDDSVSVILLMRLGSYTSRYSQAITPMKAFCHGFYGDTRGASPFSTRRVSARTVQDMWMCRTFLCLAYHHPSLLSVSIEWPVVNTWAPEAQAAHADSVVFVDAALSHNCCGVFINGILWCQHLSPIISN
jgi:hypothetical protein